MTKEEFEKICAIQRRLVALQNVKEDIRGERTMRLTFERHYSLMDEWRQCDYTNLRPIDDILKKHASMIRQEIDEEICLLEKEIEKL